jgi:hypothetical protein
MSIRSIFEAQENSQTSEINQWKNYAFMFKRKLEEVEK